MSENVNEVETNEEATGQGNQEEMAETQELKKQDKKDNEFESKFYYLAAEFENTKKRFEREKENLIKYGNEKVLTGLIGVIDNFDLTINALKNDEDEKVVNIVKGIDMVRGQFLDVLKQNGLTAVEALGKIFDPNFHEAVAQAPAEGKENHEIITEYQKGYILNGRLLRASKVVVVNNN